MGYQLTEIVKRCNREDADFLIATINSSFNFTDDRGLREMHEGWDGEGPMPLDLNRKIEREIRYLGSNDFAYMTRKLRGYEPAGVGVDEIIDDLCKLLKISISNASTLEARLEIFAGNLVDQQFATLPDERKRELLANMGFGKRHLQDIIDRVINKKELLLPVILPILGRRLGPQVFQGLIISLLAPFIGAQAARQLLAQALKTLPGLGPMLGPLLLGGAIVWGIIDLLGPASRKTIPLMLYLGLLCLRDGETPEFIKHMTQ